MDTEIALLLLSLPVLAVKSHLPLQAAAALGSHGPFASLPCPCAWVPLFPAGRRGDVSPPHPLGQVTSARWCVSTFNLLAKLLGRNHQRRAAGAVVTPSLGGMSVVATSLPMVAAW